MSDWPTVRLDDLATFKNGLNFPGTSWGRGTKIIGVSDFGSRMFPDYETLDEVDPRGVVRDVDLLAENDILFVRSNGNRELIGRSLLIRRLREPVSHSGFTIRLRFREGAPVSPRFYAYLFKSDLIRKTLSGSGGGTNINNLNQGLLGQLEVPVPPLDEQEGVAALLACYDDLIANNQRRIALLESMAEEIYREWFVRMRFPRHEAVQRSKGIPDGWTPATLGTIADFVMGQSPSSAHYNETGDGLPFHQGVGTYGDRFPQHQVFCSSTGRKANAGDILFSVRAPVGRLNIADTELIIGRGLAAMRHKQDLNSYLFYLLKVTFADEDMIGNGSIFNSVGKDELAKQPILCPPPELTEMFEALIKPIDAQLATLYSMTTQLSAQRDALLPRLISGKLRVDNLDIQFPPSMQPPPAKAAQRAARSR